jgi:hypothetical protein
MIGANRRCGEVNSRGAGDDGDSPTANGRRGESGGVLCTGLHTWQVIVRMCLAILASRWCLIRCEQDLKKVIKAYLQVEVTISHHQLP